MTSSHKNSSQYDTIIVIDDDSDDPDDHDPTETLHRAAARDVNNNKSSNSSNNSNSSNEKVRSLMAIMNIPESKARATLESFDYNLERAIAHLLGSPNEHQGQQQGQGQQQQTQQQQHPHRKLASLTEAAVVRKPSAQKSLFADVDNFQDTTADTTDNNTTKKAATTALTATVTAKLSPQWHECYQRTVQAQQDCFVDSDFAPTTSSLDGRFRNDNGDNDESASNNNNNNNQIKCLCGLPAAPKTVQADGPNYGRFYLACGQLQRRGRGRRAPVVVVRSPSSVEKSKNKKNQDDNVDNHNKETSDSNSNNDNSNNDNSKSKKAEVVRNPYAKNKKDSQQATVSAPEVVAPKSPSQRSSCNFFKWDPNGSIGATGYRTRYSLLLWQHFGLENHCCLYQKSIDPSQVRQGAVGNCWFLSALAVVAEKPHLVRQLLPHDALNDLGCYQVNLCLDGKWTPVIVDSNLPVVLQDTNTVNSNKNTSSKKEVAPTIANSTVRGGVPYGGGGSSKSNRNSNVIAYPAFCAAPQYQLWPALVEKAYAKAHGSYAQLSGGFIAEGLTDLTGAPTETVIFSAGMFDRDELWVRMLSFVEVGFLLGVATSQGGDGLVGGHAYSVLDVIEVRDSIVGEQSKVTDFFCRSPDKKKSKVDPSDKQGDGDDAKSAQGERTTVRLVRIRNPWGTKEWKGDWSADSEQWTKALRKRLGSDTFAKGDGTFFMSYDDMLERFHHMDVAKTREGWKYSSCDGIFERKKDPLMSSRCVYRLKPSKRTWAFVSLVQPKKRSNTQSKYWYCDPSILILKKLPTEVEWTCEAKSFVGVKRMSHCEVFLDPDYMYCCVPFSCVTHKSDTDDFEFRLTIYSADEVLVQDLVNDENCREDAVRVLHGELFRREEKLLYPIASSGLLGCVHGEGCLFFFAVNGSHDHYLSLRLTIDVQDGILVVFGMNEDTHDVAPRSQRLLLVVSGNGKTSTTTHLNFRYISSIIPVKAGRDATRAARNGRQARIGGTLDLTLAGDLLAGSFDACQASNKGGDTVDTYMWIPQLGAASN